MNKNYSVAIMGTGSRGYTYGTLIRQYPEKFHVSALCDFNPAQLDKINKLFFLPEDAIFHDEDAFFKKKRADVLLLATWDKYHVRQCVRALELGYDVLMEKPVSDSENELKQLMEVQQRTGHVVAVCHVLRYGAAYRKLKELLDEGAVGQLLAIDAMERVAYWHQAQAYVRIQSTVNDLAHPTILAKCCHDLDYIQHYAGAPCETVSSVGGLSFFKADHAPENAAERCLECPHVDTCVYSAKRIYLDGWKKNGCPEFSWPYSKVSIVKPTTEEALTDALRKNEFGKCVFRCGVDSNPHVVDHQILQMHFSNGVDAVLKMLFAAQPGRRINLFGTHGEIVLDEIPNTIEVKRFGCEPEVLRINELDSLSGYDHGGGDAGLIRDLYDIVSGTKTDYTSLAESVESHLIGIKAEVSRLSGGKTVNVHA